MTYRAHCAPTTLKDLAEKTDHAVAIISGLCQKHQLFFTNRTYIQDVLFPTDPWGMASHINPCSQCTSPPRYLENKEQWQNKTLDHLYTHLKHAHKDIRSYQLAIQNVHGEGLVLCSEKLTHIDIKAPAYILFDHCKIIIDACPNLKHLYTQDVTMCPMPNFVQSIARLESLSIGDGSLLFIPPWLLRMPHLEDLVLANNPTLCYAGNKGEGRSTFDFQNQWAFTSLRRFLSLPMALFKPNENPWDIDECIHYQAHINIPSSHTFGTVTTQPPSPQNALSGLPSELLKKIGSFLNGQDKKSLRLANHRFARLFWSPSAKLFLMKDAFFNRAFVRLYFQNPKGDYFTSTLVTETLHITSSNDGDFLKIDLSWTKYGLTDTPQDEAFVRCGPLYVRKIDNFDPTAHMPLLKEVIRQLALIELAPWTSPLFHYLEIQRSDHLFDTIES